MYKYTYIQWNALGKALLFLIKPEIWAGFLQKPFLFFSNTLSLCKWIHQQKGKGIINDFITFKRNHNKRYILYQSISDHILGITSDIDYYEFGVSSGASMKWWTHHALHPESRFYGFDTFKGLPEKWGVWFEKGDMAADIPMVKDPRVVFVPGLFQQTLPTFIKEHSWDSHKVRIFHLDADLYSSTLYVLHQLSPHFRPGDIVIFDEFNVPNHEFFAWKCFTQSTYINMELIGAVNNYYQVAFRIV